MSKSWIAAVVMIAGIRTATAAPEIESYFRPDQNIAMSNVALKDVHPAPSGAAWDRFLSTYGSGVQIFLDPRSGTPSGIVGKIPLLGASIKAPTAGVVADAVRAFVLDNADAFAVDPTQLGTFRASQVTSDLWQVAVSQTVGGIPVRYGTLAATVRHGNLVLIGTDAWGNVRIDTHPTIGADEALETGFAFSGGRRSDDVLWQDPSLEIIPYAAGATVVGESFSGAIGTGYGHRLAWVYEFSRAGEPERWRVSVDAHTGEVLEQVDTVVHFDRKVTGGVYPVTSTGVCPDVKRCGTMMPGTPMPDVNTGLPAPNDFTGSAGLFDWTAGAVTTSLAGELVKIVDQCGAINVTAPAGGTLDLGGTNGQHDCTVPAGTSAGNTAAARSVYYETTRLKEIAQGWLPDNAWLRTQITANVNQFGSCNAAYSAGTVNFIRSGNGCRNSGELAGIFDHEFLHGLDDFDVNGVLTRSAETYADIGAMYRLEDSCPGYGFFSTSDKGCGMTSDGTGFNTDMAQVGAPHCALECSGARELDFAKHADPTPLTPANWSCTSCATGPGPCGRQVHCDSLPASQAAWDLPARDLQAAPFNYDRATAFTIASKIYYQGSGNILDWHTCNCPGSSDGCSATSGYMQWLAADDDDGDLTNGTPHMTAIHDSFDRHGIACATPAPVNTGCAGAPSVAPAVTVTPLYNRVRLAWTAVPGATKYWVFRTEGMGCDFGRALVATVTGTSWEDTETLNGRDYHYAVSAVGATDACFSPLSACASATPDTCRGLAQLDGSAYTCSESIGVSLRDADLAGTGTHTVTVFSSTEPAGETVTLTEAAGEPGYFSGAIPTTSAAPGSGDGAISVADGGSLTVHYDDASACGAPSAVEQGAAVDCLPTGISNVHSSPLTGTSQSVSWTTGEAANSTVTYGTTIPPSSSMVVGALVTSHTVTLAGLAPCTTYFYSVTSADAAGNATTDTNGGSYYTFTTSTDTNPAFSYAGPAVAIPDNVPAGISIPIDVPTSKAILDVNVTVNISHIFDGNLVLRLVGPDGREIVLSQNRGGSGDHYTNTVFDDEATASITTGTAPFSGSFRPEGALSAFDGYDTRGTWRLRVSDTSASNTGSLLAWSITFAVAPKACGGSAEYTASAPADVCSGTGSGAGNGAIDPGEYVTLPMTIYNDGTTALTGVTAALSAVTPGVQIVDASAAFPDVAVKGTATTSDPFAFAVDPGLACAGSLDFLLTFTSNEGTFSDVFSLPLGVSHDAVLSLAMSGPPVEIADGALVSSTVSTADARWIKDVNIEVNITHPFDDDLVLSLVGPNGAQIRLASRAGGTGANYVQTVFDDEAAASIQTGIAPLSGSFKPPLALQPLSTYDNQVLPGTWTLFVRDASWTHAGSLDGWAVDLTVGGGAPTCSACAPLDCNDGNPCTDDTWSAVSGCVHVENAQPCDDGSACTVGDVCGGGSCLPGGPLVCDDGNPCTDDTCAAGPGCVYGNNTNPCDDGNPLTADDTCSGGACSGVSICQLGARPRVVGYYRALCDAPHSGDELTATDAACVAAISSTFSDVTSVADICAALDTTGSEDACLKAEGSLMATALNICKSRVCVDQGIESSCGAYDSVGESFAAADAVLADAGRTADTCNAADCQANEVDDGKALHLNSLAIAHVAGEIRLDWEPPLLDNPGLLHGYWIWRRVLGSLSPFTQIGTTTTPHFVDPTGLTDNFEYEFQAY
jgi:subtilisin-like proprotein convertase family protein